MIEFDVFVSLLPKQRQTVRVYAECTRDAILAAMELPEVARLLVGVGQASLIVSAFRVVPREQTEALPRQGREGLRLA